MKNRFGTLTIIAFLALSAVAQASQMTLADLKDICAGSDESSISACRFYILGVTEGAGLGAGMAKDQNHFCTPEGVSSRDMVLIVKRTMTKDLAAFPQDKGLAAVGFVAAAMMQAYPCKK